MSTLLKKLSGVKWPNKPNLDSPMELGWWIDAMYVQLDKLKQQFTGDNIHQTIVTDTGLGLPPIPDKNRSYRLEWHCDVKRLVWVETGVVCGGLTDDTPSIMLSNTTVGTYGGGSVTCANPVTLDTHGTWYGTTEGYYNTSIIKQGDGTYKIRLASEVAGPWSVEYVGATLGSVFTISAIYSDGEITPPPSITLSAGA